MWMDQEIIILSKVKSDREKKNGTMELIYKIEIDSQT